VRNERRTHAGDLCETSEVCGLWFVLKYSISITGCEQGLQAVRGLEPLARVYRRFGVRGGRWTMGRSFPSLWFLCQLLLNLLPLNRVEAQWDSGIRILDSARCEFGDGADLQKGYMDSCGVCNGNGGSCNIAATVVLVLLGLGCFSLLVLWSKFFVTQIRCNSRIGLPPAPAFSSLVHPLFYPLLSPSLSPSLTPSLSPFLYLAALFSSLPL
jgi:hypothetical protein